ncbi:MULTISPECIES: hypothetical protein [unclassified Plantibacter]|jgi:hypothetical protein|uniref:hypothetical protein n=1 Tax=unclassified Plantibacter TaxID=2624265 RepID=UPI003D34426E
MFFWRRSAKRAALAEPSAVEDDPYAAYQRWVEAGRPSRDHGEWPWDLGKATARPFDDGTDE